MRDRIAFVHACWHQDVVEEARAAFLKELQNQGHDLDQVDVFQVPGSLEIPLLAKKLAQTGRYAAIVAAAFVVDGGIYRHDFVSATVVDALMRVQLDTDVPVISAVLTPQNFRESDEHLEFFRDHFRVKGSEVAQACVQTLGNLAAIAV